MNPVKDIAIWLQYWLPTSDGWYAASVPLACMIVALGCIGVAGLGTWILIKTKLVKV